MQKMLSTCWEAKMTEQQNTNRERLENIWLRLVFMLVFFIGHRVSSFILMVIAVIQFILVLLKREKNERLLEFSISLNKYIYQSGTYLSFEHDLKPFPFDNWPESAPGPDPIATETSTGGDSNSSVVPDVTTEAEDIKPAEVKKTTTRKAPVKRKPSAAQKDTAKTADAKPKTTRKPAASKAAPEGNES